MLPAGAITEPFRRRDTWPLAIVTLTGSAAGSGGRFCAG